MEEERRLEQSRIEEENNRIVAEVRRREEEEEKARVETLRRFEEEQEERRERERLQEEEQRRIVHELEQQQMFDEEQERLRLEEELLRAQDESKKPAKKSRSASRDRLAALKAVKDSQDATSADDDDMIYDEEHQIKDKEDLFAMIGDTSLKGAKLRRKKPSTSEDAPDEAPPRGTRSKKSSTSSAAADDEVLQELKPKTRTPSRDRQGSAQQAQAEEVQKRGAKSRTASGERPLSFHQDEDTAAQPNIYSSTDSMIEKPDEPELELHQISKSRSGSRGKGKNFEADYEAERYDTNMEGRTSFGMEGAEDYTNPDESTDWWGTGGKTSSSWMDDQEDQYQDQEEDQEKPFVKSRTASKDRAGNQRLQGYGEEDQLAETGPQKSRTASRERPGSSQEGGPQRSIKSRTASRERRAKNVDDDDDAEMRQLEEVGFIRPTSRTGSSLGHQQEGSQRGIKSRTASGDKREKALAQDYEEDYQPEEDAEMSEVVRRPGSNLARPESRGAKSRTASGERPGKLKSSLNYEDDQMLDESEALSRAEFPETRTGPKSRTASRERPGMLRAADQDESDSSRSRPEGGVKAGQKSRTASRERPLSFKPVQAEEDVEMAELEQLEQLEQEGAKPGSRPLSRQGVKSRTTSKDRVGGSRQLAADEVDFDEDGFPIKTSGSRTQSRDRVGNKSRTTSRERPRDFQVAAGGDGGDEEYFDQEESEGYPGAQDVSSGRKTSSRTASRERPRSGLTGEELEAGFEGYERGAKSRTGSRDRGSDVQHYRAGESEDVYAEIRPRRDRVTHSRTTSGERPGSGPHSEDQHLGLEEDFDDEDVPALEMATGEDEHFVGGRAKRITKSRTASSERPGSRQQQQQQLLLHQQGQEDMFFEPELEGQQLSETDAKAQFEKRVKSRTTSRERPTTLDLPHMDPEADFFSKQNRSRTASRERPRGHRSLRDEEEAEEEWPMAAAEAKSRSASRDGRRGQLESEDFLSVPGASGRQAKSRTASRERPGSRQAELNQGLDQEPEFEEFEDAENHFAKSRTHSRERKKEVEFGFEGDPGYDTMNGGRLRRYRDEEALDMAADDSLQPEYDYDTLDSGISDYYQHGRQRGYGGPLEGRQRDLLDEDRTPLTDEPDHIVVNPEYDMDTDYFQNEAGGNEDEEVLGRRTKKVSFAEADEKFVLRPDPEVKVIPGTKLFCFAPSETYEQPPEDQSLRKATNGTAATASTTTASTSTASGASATSSPSTKSKEKEKEKEIFSKEREIERERAKGHSMDKLSPAKSEERQLSTSPKAFLKAMLGTGRSSKEGSSEPVERRSLFDSLLRRGRSASLQGSRNSSRQNSLDRGTTSERGYGKNMPARMSFDSAALQQRPQPLATAGATGGSSRAGSSVGSAELNLEQDVSDIESDYSLFKKTGNKKKKPPKVASVDFDQLFARGHAIGEQRERQTQSLTGLSTAAGFSNGHHPTPFEVYSKEEAFKQAQQGAGISYEEKVQSYLDDQQHQQGLNGHQPQIFSQYSTDSAGASFEGHESRKAERKLKRERSRSDSNKRAKDQSLERKKEPPKVIGYSKPEDIHIEPPDAPIIQASPPPTLPRPGSRLSNSGRQIDQEEFLQNMQEFVRKAEVDQEYSQPVWPAIIQSPQELPLTKAQAKAQLMSGLPPQYSNSLSVHGDASPRPVSPYDPQASFNYSLSAANPQKSPQMGYSGQRQDISPMAASPYAAQASGNFEMQRRLSADARTTGPQRPVSPYQQQLQQQQQLPYQQQRPISPYEQQRSIDESRPRMAPSPGKSYLETRPMIHPDPFQARIEPDAPPPSAAEAASIIMQSLGLGPAPIPSPRRGRSPRNLAQELPGDAHIPAMLRPDPLTAHELQPPPIMGSTLQTTQQLKLANGGEEEPVQTIRDTDLYKRLQEGLKNIDKILASESFQKKIQDSGLEYQKYSHHLGRAEFGVLKKRAGSIASVPAAAAAVGAPITKSQSAAALSGAVPKYGLGQQQPQQQQQQPQQPQRAGSVQMTSAASRDSSGERPASAMAGVGRYQPITTTGRGRQSNYSSHQGSRDSSLGRPDSRMSNYSAMPDLEPGLSGSGMTGSQAHLDRTHPDDGHVHIRIEPHPEVCEKKREVLHQMAMEKLAIKEAKGFVLKSFILNQCF